MPGVVRVVTGAEIALVVKPYIGVLTHLAGMRLAPSEVKAAHPAFDVTPARYITAIITEQGVARAPFDEPLRKFTTAQ